jgi:hypothetical protein
MSCSLHIYYIARCQRKATSYTKILYLSLQHGVDYWFVSKEEFEKGIQDGRFLEYARVHSNIYGTSFQVRRHQPARQCSNVAWRWWP